MTRLPRIWPLAGCAFGLVALAGCGGPDRDLNAKTHGAAATTPTEGISPAPAPASEPGPAAAPAEQARPRASETADIPRPRGPEQSRPVTPERAVDLSQLTKVVEKELKGGEARKGPSRADVLWQPPEGGEPQGEPLNVQPPKGLPPLTPNSIVPAHNPLTKAKVELGKQLYFDPRVSKNGTVSCATCHNPEKGWTDNLPASVGIRAQVGSRSAPTVLNTAYGRSMFWDGRAPSLEGQAQGPVQNPIEMGDQTFEEIVDRLRTISGYREQFRKVFATEVTIDGMAKAIAAFERTVLSGNSAYDRYVSGDFKALSDSQKRGMVLFGLRLDEEDEFKTNAVLKKANCTSCHAGFNFTDEQFHNLGVGWDEKTRWFKDPGRWAIAPIGAKNPSEIGAFKTPTLRDIARTAPYLHDGSEATLEKVIEFYDRGGNANPYLDKDMKKLNLSASEKADLVAFMKALTGDEVKVTLPTLPPGPDGKAPNPRDALTPPSSGTALEMLHLPVVR